MSNDNSAIAAAAGFTPGPWYFNLATGIISNAEGDPVGDVSNSENMTYEAAKANGILQSAAPELLEALEYCVAMFDEGVPECEWGHIKSNARAAIAKARGES